MEEEDLCHDECSDCSQLSNLIIPPHSYEIWQSLHLPPGNEKQISVDPQSLKPEHDASVPSKLPLKSTSCSLPASASSSPMRVSMITKSFKKRKDANQKTQRRSAEPPQPLRRSKSCGDGRASEPSDEFGIMSGRRSVDRLQNGVRVLHESSGDIDDRSSDDDGFKCGALCLFLPGISRKKPAPKQPPSPPRRQAHDNWNAERRSLVLQVCVSKLGPCSSIFQERGSSASSVASLEKFECASWASAAIVEPEDDDGNRSSDESGPLSYFDLPLELIRCSASDTCSPVKAAFMFDKDLKGVLKKNTSSLASRKSCESTTRHVRFSTSAPTSYPASPTSSPCITPRLLRAREEFNALLDATGGSK